MALVHIHPSNEFTMRITLQGTVFCVAGRHFSDFFKNRRDVEGELRRGGGEITGGVSNTTEVLVWTYGRTVKVTDAKTRGLPIINGKQVRHLLDHGFVDIEYELPSLDGHDESLNDLLGEARGVLANPPSSSVWLELVDLLTRCSPNYVEALVEYISTHIDRWHERDQMLCILPTTWMVNMSKGTSSAMYRLVRWVDLSPTRTSITAIKNIFGCADLINVRRIDWPYGKKLSKAAFAAVSNEPRFKTMRVMIFGDMFKDAAEGFCAGDALHGVHTVGSRELYGYSGDERTYFMELMECEAFAQVDCFNCTAAFSQASWGPNKELGQGLERIKHLVFDTLKNERVSHTIFQQHRLDSLLNNPSFAQCIAGIETLTILSVAGEEGLLNPWDFTSMTQLKALRIYTTEECLAAEYSIELTAYMFQLNQLTFAPTLERLVTNLPLDHPSMKAFTSGNPSIELVYEPWAPPF